jgi:hypothetical protein
MEINRLFSDERHLFGHKVYPEGHAAALAAW